MNIRNIILFGSLLLSTLLPAQQLEIYGGINSNHLYDGMSDEGLNYSSTLKSGKGYTIGFSYDNPNMNGIASRISVSFNKIKGGVSTSIEGGTYTRAEVEKNSINLAVYPFTFIVQKVYFGFGLQGNFTLSNATEGIYGFSNEVLNIEDNETFHKDLGYGVTMRAHYNIMLNNGLSIVPQYNLYYGIGEEYSTAESEKIKVWQQVLALGIAMQF